jgi:hypothetical protein
MFTHRTMQTLGMVLGLGAAILFSTPSPGAATEPHVKPKPMPTPTTPPVPTPPPPVKPAPAVPELPGPNSLGGTADPVGLIGSAAVIPFWAAPPYISVFELTSLGENPDMHVFFFTASCQRVFSLPFAMTAHDAAIAFSDELFLNFNGVAAFAKSVDNISPIALDSPITLRVHRIDLFTDSIAVVDPIAARHAEDPLRTWNPLRSGASTITVPDPPGGTNKETVLWVVCPRSNVVTDLGGGIPPMPAGPELIRARAYDLDERPLLDFQFTCQCLTKVEARNLHPLFLSEPKYVEFVTYLSDRPIANPPSFVMYREIRVQGAFESFGRAPGMSAATLLSGEPVPLAR